MNAAFGIATIYCDYNISYWDTKSLVTRKSALKEFSTFYHQECHGLN